MSIEHRKRTNQKKKIVKKKKKKKTKKKNCKRCNFGVRRNKSNEFHRKKFKGTSEKVDKIGISDFIE